MVMDAVLCDELLEEILRCLPPSSSSSVSLVSKRWLFLHRSSTTSLSLRIPFSPFPLSTVDNNNNNNNNSMSAAAMVSNILSYYPFLSRLTVVSSGHYGHPPPAVAPSLSFDDHLLVAAAVACSRRLSHPRFHPADDSPLSPSALLSTSLSLSGIRSTDSGLSWLWRRCGGLRRLQLRACNGTGPPSSFTLCLAASSASSSAPAAPSPTASSTRPLSTIAPHHAPPLQRRQPRRLRQFIHQRGAALRVLDLRLPSTSTTTTSSQLPLAIITLTAAPAVRPDRQCRDSRPSACKATAR
uniref:F-box domain-containing protein n=1 Tax=Ananas comosus var. bracteatus TaxID=296719 RepID=A0A6V7NVU7_ANACO|nr:unnamed protein product [Ananas comosus var. bracteatus]